LHESAKDHTSRANCLLSADGSHRKLQAITHSDSVNERVKWALTSSQHWLWKWLSLEM
jgi:hypothetical protein